MHGIVGLMSAETLLVFASKFGEVTGETFSRYHAAREITGDLEERLINEDKVLAETLVYSETTDYCSIKGVKTKNLPCRPDIKGPGSCELVCCGKGHRKQTIRQMVSIFETCISTTKN